MPEWTELGRKTGQRGLLIASYQGLEKRLCRAITPAAEAVCVPAHLVPPGSPQVKQLCHLHDQLSLGQSCHRQKKSCDFARRVTSVVFDSLRPCGLWPARLLCQGWSGLQARILECVGQYGLPKPSRAYFLLPWPPTPLSTWCCQNPCDPCTTSTPGPHRGKPKSSRAASGVNPSG